MIEKMEYMENYNRSRRKAKAGNDLVIWTLTKDSMKKIAKTCD